MQVVWCVVAGFAGGILGGMGMGGGTVLIPLLSIFYSVGQHSAQASNLISFLPMAVVALIVHLKNKLVKFDKIYLLIIPGLISCVVGCFIARQIDGEMLRKFFGGFLIALSVIQIIMGLKKEN